MDDKDDYAGTCDECGTTTVDCVTLCRECYHDKQAKAIKDFLEDLADKVV